MPSRSSSPRISSASGALSSTCRTRTVSNRFSPNSDISVTHQVRQHQRTNRARQRDSIGVDRLVEHGPETPQCTHRGEKLLHVHRLDHVGVDTQVPATRQITLFPRRRQDDHRNMPQVLILAHALQHLKPIHAWHLDVQQDDHRVGAPTIGPATAPMQVIQALYAILDMDDGIGQMRLGERIHGHLGIRSAVFDEQDRTKVTLVHGRPQTDAPATSVAGKEKWKCAPWSSSPSAQTRPPCRAMIRCTFAKPIPVPGNSEAPCRRWNTPNSLSAYCMSKPAPLSETVNS